ncbi:hypothetical protein [Zobellia sp. B3R18]|uniref:hypothetical protein n=1 Tax=Zobellia sp. B3R18 TaxID=2841568 RepID=UPI001C070119|nr:hypothetical protein [Zobellia sp. B3R18]MBU2974067.1 hypothetical protein [Zobellia sp. B3R18]
MTYLKKRLVLFIFLGFLYQSYGQEKQQYSGPLQVGGYEGKANYSYVVQGQDTLYNGTFQLQSSNLGALVEKEDTSFLIDGNFDKGTPNGPWHFQFGEFQTESESKLVGYEYRVLISGRQEESKGKLVNGIPNDKWTYEVNQIKSSEVEKTLFKSVINFQNGIPQQSFQIENDSTVLIGRFLRNGLAHDEWTSYSANAIDDTENWIFKEGVLKEIITVTDGLTNRVPVFGTDKTYKVVALNLGYLELLKATISSNGSVDFSGGVSELLSKNNGYYKKLNDILNEMGPASVAPNFKVKVPFYALDSLQMKTINQIARDYKAAQVISDTLLNNSHLNIVRRSDADAQYRYEVVKKINADFLQPLSTFVKYKEEDILEYMELPKLMQQLWPSGKPNTKIEVVMDTAQNLRTFVLANTGEFNFNGNSTKTVAAIAEYAKLSLQELMESLSDRLTNEARLQALNGLEKDLIAANDSLVQKIDSLQPELTLDYKAPLKNLKNLADGLLGDYALLKNPEKKLAFGNKLKVCLAELHELTGVLGDLPHTSLEIEELYQDAIWNPFMATVMQEGVKKRITSAYNEILIPHFLEEATAVNCEKVKPLTEQITHTNKRMVKLREGDTKKLERKLRKEKNPQEVMKLLHEQSIAKEK